MIPESKIREIVELTQNSVHVQRIWAARGLKPRLVETFKVSTDPHFDESLIDLCGLYVDQRENAIVLCLDEKTSIQALDHTQPSLPMKAAGKR